MAATPDIRTSQASLLTVRNNDLTSGLHVAQAVPMVPYNVPAKHTRTTQAAAQLALHQTANPIRVAQAQVMVVCSGRATSPFIRASVFTLDGHDFYMLRLGDAATLIYDNSTQQWIEWTSEQDVFWRANCSFNWIGGQRLGYNFGGSNVVVGDDSWGLLYFLDPTQGFDDHPDAQNLKQQLPFPRITMAQSLVSGRNFVPCYAVFLDGDNIGLTAIDFTPSVQLETSDDQGLSWFNHGVITIQPNTDDQDYRWTSLGQMKSPGRLFRVTDNGILARIDSLEMNDD